MKLTYWVICAFLYSSIGFAQAADSPKTLAVAALLANMVDDESTLAQLKASFAPSFAKANSISPESIGVDVYRPEHFMIQEVQGDIVTSLIWIDGFSWVHKLRFKTVEEDGRTHVMPSGMRGNMIQPWHSLETFIKIDTSTLVSNNNFPPVDSVEPLGSEDVVEKIPTKKGLSEYIQFTGDMVGANPDEDHFMLMISDAETVTFVMSLGTLSFNIYETRRTDGAVKQIFFRLEKNGLTPAALDWNEFVITDVSELTTDAKRQYTAGVISDCNYVLDINGDPAMRLLATMIAGSLD